jgi:serine/threonine protein kinase/Flp pilus assembly protein TadD
MSAARPDNEAIFHAARAIPDPDRRREYVHQACGGDEARIAQVEALLAAADAPDSLLDHPAAATPATTIEPPATECPGTVIGPYKLIEPIGEGGMGSVWMAQQTQPVKRLVAVKLIKAGMDSRQVIARFEAERQALALMDHPNIARVLDAGTTEAGRPYFVMELVRGVPVTRYCDEHRLTPKERLELFVPVCQAIQHAHQKGIIHRDLKPSNVLVARYDGRPVPKVIDFGVAKATGQQLTEQTLVTGFGAVVGTLEYMSPEQAELNQLDIDTRSDIYSLGVLLYELLTGTTPLEKKRLKAAALEEVLRLIREEEAPRPSTRLSTTAQMPSIAANRGLEPKRLAGLVRGELDWIVMKALEKDRNRRYETANGLAMDLQRYLAGEPVLAAPASQWYRLRKLVRRHRGPVVAAGLVILALLGGITGTTWGRLRAVAERDAKDAALQAEEKARQQAFAALRSMTAEVVERKFAQSTVLTEDDRVFLRGVIAQFDAFAAIQGDDADSRAVRAEGRYRVGNIRYRLGELREAEQDYDQALNIYEQLAAEFPSQPKFRYDLAGTYYVRGHVLSDTGGLPKAKQDYDQALNICKQLALDFPSEPRYRQHLARSHNIRGILLDRTGRPKEADQDYDQAASIFKQLADDFPSRPEFRVELAQSQLNRGRLLSNTGRPEEAEKAYDQALSIDKKLLADLPSRPEIRQDLAGAYIGRGTLLRHRGRLQDSEKDFDQAVSILKQLAAAFPSQPDFRVNLALSYNNRGILLRDTGRLKEAEQDYDRAIGIERELAADFPTRPEFRQELARYHNNRGSVLRDTGRLKEAEQDYDRALTIQKQLTADFPNQPDLHNSLAGACVNQAFLQEQRGNWAAAKRLLLEGEPHHLAALKANPRHPQYREFYRNHLALLTAVHAGLLEQDVAVRTAETCRDLGWDAAADGYSAAVGLSLCVLAVAKHDKLDAKRRKEAAQFYGDKAMKLLRDAVSQGYKDVAQMKKDTDLDPLRQREDFQKLLVELEGKAK